MTEFSCNFHPDRNAVSQCEKCGVLFCSECRKENSIYHGPSRKMSPENEILCPLCYKSTLLDNIKRNKIIRLSIGIFLGIITLFTLVYERGQFVFIPIILFAFIFIVITWGINQFQSDLEQIEVEISQMPGKIVQMADDFRRSNLKAKEKKFQEKKEEEIKIVVIYCQQCGSMMDVKATFCPNCGDPTDDEHAMLDGG